MAGPTPMRSVPGAFFNTPAPAKREDPTRRRLFDDATPAGNRSWQVGTHQDRDAGGDLTRTTQNQAADTAAPLPPIQKAARSVNHVLQQDESYPDLDSYCRPGASSEYDLPVADSSWAPFHRVQMYPIPDEILELYNGGQLAIKMGLFPEIGHAWASIDNALLIWDYTHPNPELVAFEETPHAIRAVALVPPKRGVFTASINHVLVIATTIDVILVGVGASTTPAGAKTISLFRTKFTVPRGGADVGVIVGTSSGRVFMGGDSDTDIYEFHYQSEDTWFSNRCHKINHTHPGWSLVVPSIDFWASSKAEHLVDIAVDDTRNLLYTLSNKSTIRTYHIEAPDKLTKVIEKEKNHCLRDIAHMVGSSPLLTERISIVSMSPISAREASKLHLMALTNTGCRLFLSATSSASYMMSASTNLAPQSMQVQFVKFPPPEQPGQARLTRSVDSSDALDLQSRALETSRMGRRFPPGFFFDFVGKETNPDGDLLFVSAPETGRIKATTPTSSLKYFEHGNWIDLGVRSRALAVGQITGPFAAARQPLGFGNELAVQFDEPPSEFAIMTNDGVHVVRRRRLVDIFATAIRNAAGDDGLDRETRKFINLYGRVETISAALAVACGQGSDLRTATGRAVDQTAQDLARAAFVNFGGQPVVSEIDGTVVSVDSVRLSSRHDALALYLTRLIRTLWKNRVISPVTTPTVINVNSTIPTSKLIIVQENLERLRAFLTTNAGSIQGLSGPSDLQHTRNRHDEIALQAEHQALHALQRLMESVSEGISFVLMLFDERVADIYTRLDEGTRQQLRDLTYESLFSQSTGKDLAKLLVKAIVSRNIESGSNVETVADALRRRCGSFCSPDDVVIFKAQEQLQRAREQIATPSGARQLLNESLRLFERVAGSLTASNLRAAVEQYVELQYYAGAIQLCLAVARERDRGNTALSWVNEGQPANDARRRTWEARKRCYDMVHVVMQRLDVDTANEPETVDGRLTLTATKRMEAYSVVNDSDDEVFHFDLYEWYFQQNWTDRIIATESPHVITFLQRLAAVDVRHAELLCRFYTHRGRFFDAAKVQYDLANSDFDIGIKDRITLLSQAKSNASVNTPGVARQQQQQLNHMVTEILEIAHIQDDLLERLQSDARIPDDRKTEVESTLNGRIQVLTDLYNNYADPAGYYDLSLLIYHTADNFHDPRAIHDAWSNLFTGTHDEVEEARKVWQAHRAGRPLPPGIEPPTAPPPKAYEAISVKVQTIAHRTSLDSIIFPMDFFLPLLCEYALTHAPDAPPEWPILLLLTQLGVPNVVVLRALETVLETHEAPFTGRRRMTVVRWINTAVGRWLAEAERGTAGQGHGAWVRELMDNALRVVTEIQAAAQAGSRTRAEAGEVLEGARRAKEAVGGLMERERGGLGGRFR